MFSSWTNHKEQNLNKYLFDLRHWADESAGVTLQYVCSISRLIYLVDDVDAVVNLLPSKDRVEVVEPVLKVVFSVTERDDDGHLHVNNRESLGW